MPLLLWAIKGKRECDVQIPLAILTYILSSSAEWLHVLTITTWSSHKGQMDLGLG